MPISVTIEKGGKPIVKPVPRSKVVELARKYAVAGTKPEKALSITLPMIRVDHTLVLPERRTSFRPKASPKQFRYRTGPLKLTLYQTIYIDSNLFACTRRIWREHEQKHVEENKRIMNRMERKMRSHSALIPIFFNPQWYPDTEKSRNEMKETIKEAVKSIFDPLVTEAIRAVDTNAEYARVRKKIFQTCPEDFYHEVVSGESLSKIALFYYGNYRSRQLIYDNKENRRKIGSDPNYITPGQRLLIPKNP